MNSLRFNQSIALTLKLFTFLLLVALLNPLCASEIRAQKLDQIFIDINVKDASLEDVLFKIEKQTAFEFVYVSNLQMTQNRYNLRYNKVSLRSILELLAKDANLVFRRIDGNISIDHRPASPQVPEIVEETFLEVRGVVLDENGQPLPGASVLIKGTGLGTITDFDGNFTIDADPDSTLIVSYIGYVSQEIIVDDVTFLNIALQPDAQNLQEVVVVGYGTQKKSDITGTVTSIPSERLEMVPNVNIAQAIQGSVPGVSVQTTSSGAAPGQSIMVRGRNSILASNDPLIILDGIPYGGSISDINPSDVESIDILKDASASAIYGSRGANGVILITTKRGTSGDLTISYDGYYAIQDFINLPDVMNGAEFYDFKMTRAPEMMTIEEREIYESGNWENWYDLLLRQGNAQQHNVSISGGTEKTNFYVAGGFLDVNGVTINDSYQRFNSRINIDTKVKPWLTIGSRSQYTYSDQSGVAPSWSQAYSMNPLSSAFDEEGQIRIYPWEGNTSYANPLQETLYDNTDKSYQIITNNYADIKLPFIDGLSYRLNTGFSYSATDYLEYRGRDTKSGLDSRGTSISRETKYTKSVIENILSYNKTFGRHTVSGTAVYSFEENNRNINALEARGFPNDFLSSYAVSQAEILIPEVSIENTKLISQMLRLNYSYDSRYLLTITGRRDGYSGFGADTKWGVFPSVALGWNVMNEDFFKGNLFNQLKIRASYGLNGNQAVGAYETLTRLGEYNMVDGNETQPGFVPSVLGQDNLGWESSRTINFGVDFGMLNNRIRGDFNLFRTRTKDLLMNRTISPVHGISSIVQNIGETENKGIELSIHSTNISTDKFTWSTSANLSYIKNKIVSLYGIYDENGIEINDVANSWFVGEPINVIYDHKRIGTWQLDEAEEAALWGSQPGFVKFEDINGDYVLDDQDRQIIGQRDPDFLWGLTNALTYKNFGLSVFVHGVHGLYKHNPLMTDDTTGEVRSNTINKNWWTPDNPTNEWVANDFDAEIMGGVSARNKYYQNASFIRVKDISLFYNLPEEIIKGLNSRIYITGRNLFTFSKYTGLDPEVNDQRGIPLQREIVLGLNLKF